MQLIDPTPHSHAIFLAMSKLFDKAIQAIDKHGALLVYPIKNKAEPLSLWSTLYPRTEMVWAWDDEADNKVALLWHLREQLSTSEKVVYAKWYQGRATFFSKEVFTALMTLLAPQKKLSQNARHILEVLEQDSPISTKQIKQAVDLQGRSFEGFYNKAMKELWDHMLIVAFGEVQDSSFPSLAVGSTKLIFEELWRKSKELSPDEAQAILDKSLSRDNPFINYAKKLLK